jgi:pimeloyl-ACP methyl ester carboxylesterase
MLGGDEDVIALLDNGQDLDQCAAELELSKVDHEGRGMTDTSRQSDKAIRDLIAAEIWAYHEMDQQFGPIDGLNPAGVSAGAAALAWAMCNDEAERIRKAVLASSVVRARVAESRMTGRYGIHSVPMLDQERHFVVEQGFDPKAIDGRSRAIPDGILAQCRDLNTAQRVALALNFLEENQR